MLLALDTSTDWSGIALYDGRTVLAEHGWISRRKQSVELAPAVDQLLNQADISADDLKGVGVAVGPGSYTGVRIGLALAKGIALAHQIPLVGVPTLHVIAAGQPQTEGRLQVVTKAGRRRITTGQFRWHRNTWRQAGDPQNTTWEELIDALQTTASDVQGNLTFAGEISSNAARLLRSAGPAYRVAPAPLRVRRAAWLAHLAWQKLRRDGGSAAHVTPIYIKGP